MIMSVVPHAKFEGVFLFREENKEFLATKSLLPNFRIHGERIVREGTTEYRVWDAYTSKLAGAIRKGLSHLPFRKGTRVLYLGSASGVTPSFIADIIGNEGVVYCVEFSPRVMRNFLLLCEKRENMMPLLADANKPESYEKEVGKADVLYQDVAQPNQAEILSKNARMFLESGGYALLCIKSQSIDVTLPPRKVFESVRKELEPEFEIIQALEMEPFDKDHEFLLLKKK